MSQSPKKKGIPSPVTAIIIIVLVWLGAQSANFFSHDSAPHEVVTEDPPVEDAVIPPIASMNNPSLANYQRWMVMFETLGPDLSRAGVEVINCSLDTALDCFPKAKLEDVL